MFPILIQLQIAGFGYLRTSRGHDEAWHETGFTPHVSRA